MTSQVSARGNLAPHGTLAVSTVTLGFHGSWVGVVFSWHHWVESKQCQKEDVVR